ncbi:hypothetical protein JMJ35_003153 [Cladonia borealis]|uniref:Topoisomerase 6 subunit A/Spo11 TOPRIM domain-containing protein n=1 Tax=Cladonia borealis TaxID=184061 RepID=A0AA39R6V8_9LECA|nr:hypothetical protein JMJ35_003153 [Cladonia borealis]
MLSTTSWNTYHTSHLFQLELTGVQPIPQLMGQMFVARVDNTKSIKAVVVTEQGNLDMVSANVAREADGVFIIMLGGYATIASREFIKRLSETSVLKNVPFIWVADHDPDAWTIYKKLDYGSMATPYLSSNLCISRLEWGGITKAQFANVISLAKKEMLRELTQQNRHWSVAKVEQRLRNLQRLRGVDDRLNREVQEMLTTKKGIFSYDLFTETRIAGLDMLMIDVPKQSVLTPDNLDLFDTTTSLPMPHDSDDTRMWNELDSNNPVATAARQGSIRHRPQTPGSPASSKPTAVRRRLKRPDGPWAPAYLSQGA